MCHASPMRRWTSCWGSFRQCWLAGLEPPVRRPHRRPGRPRSGPSPGQGQRRPSPRVPPPPPPRSLPRRAPQLPAATPPTAGSAGSPEELLPPAAPPLSPRRDPVRLRRYFEVLAASTAGMPTDATLYGAGGVDAKTAAAYESLLAAL